jgi:hypothetical protein
LSILFFLSGHDAFASQTPESHFVFIPIGSKIRPLTSILSDPINFSKWDAGVQVSKFTSLETINMFYKPLLDLRRMHALQSFGCSRLIKIMQYFSDVMVRRTKVWS